MSSTTSSPLGATRRLGTQSGAMRREARRITRAGGNADNLLQQAAVTKLNEGSAISSADSAIEQQRFQQRAQNGIAAGQRGVLNTLANQSKQGQGQGLTGGGVMTLAGTGAAGSTGSTGSAAPGPSMAPGTGPTGGVKPALPPVGIGVTRDEGAEKRMATEDQVYDEVIKRTTGEGVGLSRSDALEQINAGRRSLGKADVSIDFAARSKISADKRKAEFLDQRKQKGVLNEFRSILGEDKSPIPDWMKTEGRQKDLVDGAVKSLSKEDGVSAPSAKGKQESLSDMFKSSMEPRKTDATSAPQESQLLKSLSRESIRQSEKESEDLRATKAEAAKQAARQSMTPKELVRQAEIDNLDEKLRLRNQRKDEFAKRRAEVRTEIPRPSEIEKAVKRKKNWDAIGGMQ
jgi:hypothetical protein